MMGYRSCVAILMYGKKEKCDMANDLFLNSGVAQELKDLFERQRQENTSSTGTHFVFWSFDNIKWYDACDSARNELFRFVDSIEEADDDTEAKESKRQPLAAEYARIGEEDNDVEHEGTEHHDWLLSIQRSIDYPQDLFKWKE